MVMNGIKKSKGRGVIGALLLSLLAVCGFAGAAEPPAQTVSVPVIRTQYMMEDGMDESVESAQSRLSRDRERELELLRGVAENEFSDEELRYDALKQIDEIVQRMEIEARAKACLTELGFSDALPIVSAQGLTIICPSDSFRHEEERLSAINAVCSVSTYEPRDIKIILAKK